MYKLPPLPPTLPPLRIERFAGVNYNSTPTQLNENESPEMLNMNIDERGALNKRTGYERIFQSSLGPGQINGMFRFQKKDGTTIFLFAHGTKLYKHNQDSQPTQIYNGVANARVRFFTMNDKCYIMDGTNYLVFDGTTVSQVTPYIPTLTLGRSPDGGGTPYEDWNLIGTGFKDSFSTDGTKTVFQLSLTNLDATPVKAEVDGAIKTEGTDFNVDRVNGKVTFNTAPPKGTNNVIITAYKTMAGFPERIKKCTINVLFGGSNDTRVFVSGNPDYPNWIWRSGLYDPTYWPENGFQKIGSDAGRIQAFAKQYDTCIILKEYAPNDTPIWNMQFQLDSEGKATFPVKPVNDAVGCLAMDSVQIIENSPVFLDRTGVQRLVSTTVRDERNVEHISTAIEPNLLYEPNLSKAASIDYDRKYWLALNGKVYIWDYPINQWYPYDNIYASCFMESDGDLYFGSSIEGLIYRFKKPTDEHPYNDDGQTIHCYWKSKQFSFNADERRKLVKKVFVGLKPSVRSSVDLYYVSNKKESSLIKTVRKDLFHYGYLDYSLFTYATREFPQEEAAKIKAKKIIYFQLQLENRKMDESVGILSVVITYQYQSEVK